MEFSFLEDTDTSNQPAVQGVNLSSLAMARLRQEGMDFAAGLALKTTSTLEVSDIEDMKTASDQVQEATTEANVIMEYDKPTSGQVEDATVIMDFNFDVEDVRPASDEKADIIVSQQIKHEMEDVQQNNLNFSRPSLPSILVPENLNYPQSGPNTSSNSQSHGRPIILNSIKLRFLVALHNISQSGDLLSHFGNDSTAPFKVLCFQTGTTYEEMLELVCQKFQLKVFEGESILESIQVENGDTGATIVVDDGDSWEYALELSIKSSKSWSKDPIKMRVYISSAFTGKSMVESQDIEDLIRSAAATAKIKQESEYAREHAVCSSYSRANTSGFTTLETPSLTNGRSRGTEASVSEGSSRSVFARLPNLNGNRSAGELKTPRLNKEVLAKRLEDLSTPKRTSTFVVKVEPGIDFVSRTSDHCRPSTWTEQSEDDHLRRLSTFEDTFEDGQVREPVLGRTERVSTRDHSVDQKSEDGIHRSRTSQDDAIEAKRHRSYRRSRDDRSRSPHRAVRGSRDRERRYAESKRVIQEERTKDKHIHDEKDSTHRQSMPFSVMEIDSIVARSQSRHTNSAQEYSSTDSYNTDRALDPYSYNGKAYMDNRFGNSQFPVLPYRGNLPDTYTVESLSTLFRPTAPMNVLHAHKPKALQGNINLLSPPSRSWQVPKQGYPSSNYLSKVKKAPRSIIELATRYSGTHAWTKYELGTGNNPELKLRMKDVNDFGAEWNEVFSPDFPLDPETRNGQGLGHGLGKKNLMQRGGVMMFFFRSRPVQQGVSGFGCDVHGECSVVFNLAGLEPNTLSYTVQQLAPNHAVNSTSATQHPNQVLVIQFCISQGVGYVHRGHHAFQETEWPAGVSKGRHITYNSANRSHGPNAHNLKEVMRGLTSAAMSGRDRTIWVRCKVSLSNGGWDLVDFIQAQGAKRIEKVGDLVPMPMSGSRDFC